MHLKEDIVVNHCRAVTTQLGKSLAYFKMWLIYNSCHVNATFQNLLTVTYFRLLSDFFFLIG